jgi:hypothetical protein
MIFFGGELRILPWFLKHGSNTVVRSDSKHAYGTKQPYSGRLFDFSYSNNLHKSKKMSVKHMESLFLAHNIYTEKSVK